MRALGNSGSRRTHCPRLHFTFFINRPKDALQLLRSFLSPLFLLCSCFRSSHRVCVGGGGGYRMLPDGCMQTVIFSGVCTHSKTYSPIDQAQHRWPIQQALTFLWVPQHRRRV